MGPTCDDRAISAERSSAVGAEHRKNAPWRQKLVTVEGDRFAQVRRCLSRSDRETTASQGEASAGWPNRFSPVILVRRIENPPCPQPPVSYKKAPCQHVFGAHFIESERPCANHTLAPQRCCRLTSIRRGSGLANPKTAAHAIGCDSCYPQQGLTPPTPSRSGSPARAARWWRRSL